MSGERRLDVRRLRERVAAVGQYVYELRAPLEEELRHAPLGVRLGLEQVERACDDVDRALAKLDGQRGAVGGEVRLAAVADAVRAERERADRYEAALREIAEHRESCEYGTASGCGRAMEGIALRALPADGNTEEED